MVWIPGSFNSGVDSKAASYSAKGAMKLKAQSQVNQSHLSRLCFFLGSHQQTIEMVTISPFFPHLLCRFGSVFLGKHLPFPIEKKSHPTFSYPKGWISSFLSCLGGWTNHTSPKNFQPWIFWSHDGVFQVRNLTQFQGTSLFRWSMLTFWGIFSKKSSTGPTEQTPKPEYLIAPSQLP